MSEITTDPQTNQFLPGNVWRFKKGKSGHPAKYTYKTIRVAIIAYINQQVGQTQRYTWAGLAEYLGMTRDGLTSYRKGEIGKDRPAIVYALNCYRTAMESQLEQRLTDRQYSTAGVIRALEVQDRETWGDHKQIDIDIKQRIEIAIDPDSQLAQRLAKAGAVTITQMPESIEKS